MKRLLLSTVIFSCSLLLASESSSTISPSFDCRDEAKLNRVERLICSDEELINYQKEIERQYDFISKINKIRNDWRNGGDISEIYKYLNSKRDECKTKECLLKFYKKNNLFVGSLRWTVDESDKNFPNRRINADYSNRAFITTSEQIEKGEKLCKNLFNDLANDFDNITIIEPVVQMVPYSDERLKKALGSCYEARMDLNKLPYRSIDGLGYFSLWSVDIDKDGKEEIIFTQHYKSLDEDEIVWHLLDKDICQSKLQQPNFNPEKDKVTSAYDFTLNYNAPLIPPVLISYDNEIHIVNAYTTKIHHEGLIYRGSVMSLHTFYKNFKTKQKMVFPNDHFYSIGSYELFHETCGQSFWANNPDN